MKYVYYYTKKSVYNEILKNGIDLHEYYNTKIVKNDDYTFALTCYLNPKDSILYNDNDYTIFKILVSDSLEIIIANDSLDTPLLEESFVDISNYNKGTYEYPVALICSSIPSKYISSYSRILDFPIDYNTSDELYYSFTLDNILEDYKMNNKTTLWAIREFMHDEGLFEMYEYTDSYIYIDKKTKKKYTISIG